MLVIEGEPGIGKTAFLRRCIGRAEDFVVLEAVGDEAETTLDLGVVAELIARAPAGPQASGEDAGGPPSSFSAGADLLALLGAAQDTGPVLVAIDDAQWIDAASAGALCFAVRRLHADRVCVLVATRPRRTPARAGRDCSTPAIAWSGSRLGGLDRREVGRLAGSLGHAGLTGAAAERLRAHTGGHPLYVRALLAELPPDVLTTGHGTLPAPRSFAATVLARLAGVGPATEELVAAAAVAGPRCTLELAGAAAGLDDPLPALDAALAAGLLARVPGRVPAEIAFPHPLLRAAVYDDLSPTRRRDLHLACARLTTGATSLVHRVSASPGTDDALAAELVDAGEAEVARGRVRAAVELLLLGSRVAGDVDVREAALLHAVDCLGVAGDVPRAQSLRDEVAACRASPRRSFVLATLTASAGRLAEALGGARRGHGRPEFGTHRRTPRARALLARHRRRLRRAGGGGDQVGRARARRRPAVADRARHRTAGARARAGDHGKGQEGGRGARRPVAVAPGARAVRGGADGDPRRDPRLVWRPRRRHAIDRRQTLAQPSEGRERQLALEGTPRLHHARRVHAFGQGE